MSWSTSDRRSRLPADWEKIRSDVLKRDKGLCQVKFPGCKRRATQVDHKERGDDHRPENLQAICQHCHGIKSSQEGREAWARLKSLRRRPAERHPGLR